MRRAGEGAKGERLRRRDANAEYGRGETEGNAGNKRPSVWPNVGFGVFSGCFQRREGKWRGFEAEVPCRRGKKGLKWG